MIGIIGAMDKEVEGLKVVMTNVSEEEIAGIVAKWTGIPVQKLVEGEREKLLNLFCCRKRTRVIIHGV